MRFDFITDPYLRYLKSRHPFEYSRIIDGLYIAAWPTEEDVEVIKSLGVRLVICMDWVKPDAALNESPLHLISVSFKDLGPFTSIPLPEVTRGVETALPVLRAGNGTMALW